MNDLQTLLHWLEVPLFDIGTTPVSAVRLFGLVLIIIGAWWVAGRIEAALRQVAHKHATSAASIYAWARVVRYAIWALATFFGLNYLGINLASFAIVGGAVGVGVGFGLQNIFSNFFSGIILLLEKTIKEGDFVDLQSGTRGHVNEIGLRYTRITTNDEVDVIVPNSEFINGRVVNWTYGSEFRRMHVPFGVAYDSDKDVVKAAVLQAAASIDATVSDGRRQPEVWLVDFGDSSLDFELVVWVGGHAVDAPAKMEAAYKWAIHTELVNANVEIPFPQRDLNIRGGELHVRLARRESAVSAEAPRTEPGAPGDDESIPASSPPRPTGCGSRR